MINASEYQLQHKTRNGCCNCFHANSSEGMGYSIIQKCSRPTSIQWCKGWRNVKEGNPRDFTSEPQKEWLS